MPTSIVMTDIRIDPDGTVVAKWSDGRELTWASIERLTEELSEIDNNDNMARLMSIAYLLARQPDLSPNAVIVGKTFTFDLSDNNPIKVQ